LAWTTDHVGVLANTWWEPLTFTVPGDAGWTLYAATAPLIAPAALVADAPVVQGAEITLAPRSVVVLAR
jgi:hypothetical protein